MAIQLPNPGLGDAQTGDNEFVMWTKVKDNFSNTTHAASRIVGKNGGNLLEAGTGGIGWITTNYTSKEQRTENGFFNYLDNGTYDDISGAPDYQMSISVNWVDPSSGAQILIGVGENPTLGLRSWSSSAKKYVNYRKIYFEGNTTKDSNGFIKASSPVLRVFSDHIEGNDDGEKMGAKFVKKGVGNYLIKGTTGLADEGWKIELPQDDNKNPLVAVEVKGLDNGDVSLKTYKRKFNFETASIVADHDNALDIPDTRWIDLRFNEIKKDEVANEPIE